MLGFPRLLWLVVAALLAALVGYALLVPAYHNPDEYNHVDLVQHLRQHTSYPDYDQARLSLQVEASTKAAGWVGRGPSFGRLEAGRAVPRERRPSFAELAPDGHSTSRNQVANHPFLYYLLVGKALAVVDLVWPGARDWPHEQTVVLMRLLGAPLVAAVPLLAFAAARRFGAAPAVCLTAALLPLANPQLVRQGASVNNDSLLLALAAVLTLLMARVWTGDRSPATAALVGGTLGLALLTKGFALALVPWVVLAYARSWWRARSSARSWWRARSSVTARDRGPLREGSPAPGRLRAAVHSPGRDDPHSPGRDDPHSPGRDDPHSPGRGRPRLAALGAGGLALGLAALVGGWWWLRNLLVFGTVQTELEGRWGRRVFDTDPVGWAWRFAGRMTGGFWGFFGQLEVPLDRVAVLAPIVVATAVTVVGIVASLRARRPWTPGTTPFLLWPIAGILAVLVPGAYRIYSESSLFCCMHGRYLLPGMTALAVVVAVGWGRLAGRRQHLLPLAALALGGLLHGVAVPSLLLLHYGPPDPSLAESVRGLADWTPWPARGVAVLLAACALVVALLAVRLVWATLAGTLPLSGPPAEAGVRSGGPPARAAVTTGDRQKEHA